LYQRAATNDAIDAYWALHFVCVSDYEWHVQLAAKGMAERDNHPMPKSVTTPEAFYEVMAAAALDFAGFPALLERVARAERELEIIEEALGRADAKAKNARHQPMTYEADFSVSSFASILRGASTGHGPERMSTDDPVLGLLSTDAEQSETVGERRRLSAVPSPLHSSGGTRPLAAFRQLPNRRARGSRRPLATLHALVARMPRVRSTA
jgi:hypothetical protein